MLYSDIEIGKRLRIVRKSLKLTQQQVDDDTSDRISRALISLYEKGLQRAPSEYLFYLQGKSDYTTDWMLTGKSPSEVAKAAAEKSAKYSKMLPPKARQIAEAYQRSPDHIKKIVEVTLKINND